MTSAARAAQRAPQGRPWRRSLGALILVACMTGCATTQGPASSQEVADPIEPVNRAIFGFNMFVDRWLLEPVARAYRFVTPEPARRSVANFLANLRSPVIFANDALQGERERAGITLGRFMINTTLGVAGLFDAASAFGYPRHDEDFGQTLGVWGVPDGPYLMLPLLGPSNGRDTAGRVGDYFINPLNHCCIDQDARLGLFGVTAVSEREANIELLDDLRANSIDLYATIRTIYTQKRAADIRNGRAPTDQEGYEDIFKEEDTAP
jgi:phospholipid-binding lipoprotein MlaA